jgi:hypothetical protein
MPKIPDDPAEGTTPGTVWAKLLSEWVCIIVREYIDRDYGNCGCLIDFDIDRAILTSLRLLYPTEEGEDPTSLACLDDIEDATDYCIRCEHVIVVISRWARCSVCAAGWITKNVPAEDQRTAFAGKLYFPDFRHHNEGHYPAHYFNPGPLVTVTPQRTPAFSTLREAGKQPSHAAESGCFANEAVIKDIVSKMLPTLQYSMKHPSKRSADNGGTTSPDPDDHVYDYSYVKDTHGLLHGAREEPPPKRRKLEQPAAGDGSGAEPKFCAHGGGPSGRKLIFTDTAAGPPDGPAPEVQRSDLLSTSESNPPLP